MKKEKNEKNEVTLIIRKVPRELRQKFHARCALEGITMQDKIIFLIEKATKEVKDDEWK